MVSVEINELRERIFYANNISGGIKTEGGKLDYEALKVCADMCLMEAAAMYSETGTLTQHYKDAEVYVQRMEALVDANRVDDDIEFAKYKPIVVKHQNQLGDISIEEFNKFGEVVLFSSLNNKNKIIDIFVDGKKIDRFGRMRKYLESYQGFITAIGDINKVGGEKLAYKLSDHYMDQFERQLADLVVSEKVNIVM